MPRLCTLLFRIKHTTHGVLEYDHESRNLRMWPWYHLQLNVLHLLAGLLILRQATQSSRRAGGSI
jgi:hypothetical protein